MWHTQRRRHTEGRSNQERARRACGPARECGQNAQAEAHAEHGAHVCDAGGVKAQRLIESIRILPSPKRRHPDAEGNVCGTEEKAHRGGRIKSARGVRAAQLGSVGRTRTRKRTLNMNLMSVTTEVSKLSGWLKAAAFCRAGM